MFTMGTWLGFWFGLMGWLLLPDALRPFKIYCAPPTIISQLVLFMWQTVEINPLEHVRVVEALHNCPKMRLRAKRGINGKSRWLKNFIV